MLDKLEVVPASIHHCFLLSPNLRQADKDEIKAATGGLPLRSLVEGVKSSKQAWTLLYKGQPVFIFGVVDLGKLGAVWALGAEFPREIRKPLLRYSKWWLEWLSRDFEYVGNLIDCRNTVHIRWLEWLGFTMCEAHFRNGYKFLRFAKCVSPPQSSPSSV